MWVVPWGLLLRLPWRVWVCPCEGQVCRWYSCLGHRDSSNTRYSGGLTARRVWHILLDGISLEGLVLAGIPLEEYGSQYWPICSSILAGDTPTRPQQRSLAGHSLQGHKELNKPKWPCVHRRKTFFCLWLLCLSESWAWRWHSCLACGDPDGGKCAGHGLPPPQELWSYQTLFWDSCSWWSEGLFEFYATLTTEQEHLLLVLVKDETPFFGIVTKNWILLIYCFKLANTIIKLFITSVSLLLLLFYSVDSNLWLPPYLWWSSKETEFLPLFANLSGEYLIKSDSTNVNLLECLGWHLIFEKLENETFQRKSLLGKQIL